MTEIDKRRYAYEKAIEAYWKHVDRYHTWMNYYSLFNGALFVGFCTLLTATTKINFNTDSIDLINNYDYYTILICIIGVIASICWRLSLSGHMKWEKNWMNIIELYEQSRFGIYTIINMNVSDMEKLTNSFRNHQLSNDERIKAFSTHFITSIFIESIILGWLLYLFIFLYNIDFAGCKCTMVFLSIIFILIYFIRMFYYICKNGFYSDVKGKIWINKFI